MRQQPGYFANLPIDRPLSIQEEQEVLSKNMRNDVDTSYFGSLIKINSNYVESIDINYHRRGLAFLLTGIGMLVILAPIIYLIFLTFGINQVFTIEKNPLFSNFLFQTVLFSGSVFFLFFMKRDICKRSALFTIVMSH